VLVAAMVVALLLAAPARCDSGAGMAALRKVSEHLVPRTMVRAVLAAKRDGVADGEIIAALIHLCAEARVVPARVVETLAAVRAEARA